MALRLCPSCARHVRSTETSCPFCTHALDNNAGRPLLASSLSRGVTRAAILFASAAAVAAGCGGETDSNSSSSSGASGTTSSSSSSGNTSSSSGGSSSGTSGDPTPVPMYGPAPVDAGPHDAASDVAPDAKKDSGVAVLYGPAPVPDGG